MSRATQKRREQVLAGRVVWRGRHSGTAGAILATLLVLGAIQARDAGEASGTLDKLDKSYSQQIRPTVQEYCLGCHSTEKHKGDLDLERFVSLQEVLKHPKVWQGVIEQLSLGEMPPK